MSVSKPSFEAHVLSLLQRIQRGLSTVELVHVPHKRWPLPLNLNPNRRTDPNGTLRVSVLDSSFNPPTLAHLALANSSFGGRWGDDDAKLLLLSVRNVDKTLKPGDATYLQRLQMMVLLAKDIAHTGRDSDTLGDRRDTADENNVAVAIIDQPTFVGKSSTLLAFLRSHLSSLHTLAPASPPWQPQLTFLQGFDTLERLFAPRYYPSEEAMMVALRAFFSPSGDNSRVVCARRTTYVPGSSAEAHTGHVQQQHQDEYERERSTLAAAREFIDNERVVLVDIGEDERTFSSSEVRERRAAGGMEWRRFVTPDIAEFVEAEGLYVAPGQAPSLN
ncbi:hypothetical protein PLICRDRAFT_45246 [Plicaturopsis crispa FD-325 SS-3]|uniref:Nucleotidylyl transferase n=1 Tax=Plicaturopsis crispa FD-325 SS-3 TaxID=944288 RepID=A0A0C9SRY5_PLICR|nr:hypothetical protein PLICRDRAFT_45246 [Plicaturopsis crispa FD-325 SS-3]